MKIGLYPIVGDCLHAGHMLAMKEAKEHCDYLIAAVNVNPDNKVPVQSAYERFIQLDSIKYVDKVIPYSGSKDLELLCASYPHDIRFLGSDYINKDFNGKGIEESLGIEIYYLQRNHNMSSTSLKERIKNS